MELFSKFLIENNRPTTPNNVSKNQNYEQKMILRKVGLANVLLFGAGTLDAEQTREQERLQSEYLQGLKQGDTVGLGINISGMMGGEEGTVISNDGKVIMIESSFSNKKKKNGERAFHTTNGYSRGPICFDDDKKPIFYYIEIPASHRVQSTRGLPQEARDEIQEIYDEAGEEDPTIAYYEDFTQNALE